MVRNQTTSTEDFSILGSLPSVQTTPEYNWYLCNAINHMENKTKKNIEIRTKNLDMQDHIIQVIVPTREIVSIKNGVRKITREKLYPGYLLVFMKLTSASFSCVQDSPGILGFVNIEEVDPVTELPKLAPITLSEEEMNCILEHIKMPTKDLHLDFLEGDTVEITEGPMIDFFGTITDMNSTKGTLSILLSIFGRDTNVEIPAEICRKRSY